MKGMKWKGVLIGFLRLIEELGSGRRVSKNQKKQTGIHYSNLGLNLNCDLKKKSLMWIWIQSKNSLHPFQV